VNDPLTFYRQVCELVKTQIPGCTVELSAGMAGYREQWFPAFEIDNALFIHLPDGRTIPFQMVRDWRFTLSHSGLLKAEIFTWPNWPRCRNFAPDSIVSELASNARGSGLLR
jgi:hypothetical protein